jgi:hypothetical protein
MATRVHQESVFVLMTGLRPGVITVPEAVIADCFCAAIHWGCLWLTPPPQPLPSGGKAGHKNSPVETVAGERLAWIPLQRSKASIIPSQALAIAPK